MDIQRDSFDLPTGPVELLLPHPDAECVKCIGILLCFREYVLCGRLPKYPIDIPSPLCSMLSHDSFSPDGPVHVTSNKRRPMLFRTGSDRVAFAFTSQANRTTVRLEVNRDHLFSEVSAGLFGAHTKVMWLHSHQRKRT